MNGRRADSRERGGQRRAGTFSGGLLGREDSTEIRLRSKEYCLGRASVLANCWRKLCFLGAVLDRVVSGSAGSAAREIATDSTMLASKCYHAELAGKTALAPTDYASPPILQCTPVYYLGRCGVGANPELRY